MRLLRSRLRSYRLPHKKFWLIAALLLLAAVVAGARVIANGRMADRLLRIYPGEIDNHPDLVKFAASRAPAVFAANCASCHGAGMQGNSQLGAPSLIDKYWLYGDGSTEEIERTIFYGIRSGAGKTHNVTEMTAFGTTGQLSKNQVNDMVQYLLELNNRPYQQEAADAGMNLFFGKAACFDCHGQDARGDQNYGAPNLTNGVWNNGGTEADLYRDIYNGIHHICPAWLGKLTLLQIRELAVMLHTRSMKS